jgi:hypothetical protein
MPLAFRLKRTVGRPIGPRPAISRPLPRRTRHLPRSSKPANGRLRPNGPPHNQTGPRLCLPACPSRRQESPHEWGLPGKIAGPTRPRVTSGKSIKHFLLVWLACAISPVAAQIVCRENAAIRLADSAFRDVLAGNISAASQSLQEAAGMCPTSCVINSRVAAVYRIAGRANLAENFEARRDTLCVKFAVSSITRPLPPGPQTNPQKPLSYVRQKYALVVGIGKFQDSHITTLKYAAKDARDFAAMLTDPEVGRFRPENVKVLTDEQGTTRNIRSALYEIASKALADDLVVLYISTHGSNPKGNQTKQGSGLFVTHDTETKNAQTLFATAFGMGELVRFVQDNLRAERTVILLDSCFSGDTNRIFQGGSSSGDGAKALELEGVSDETVSKVARVGQGRGIVVVSSSTSTEVSWESDEKQNSFFTLALNESMRKRKGMGSVLDLFTDIQYEIPASVLDYTRKKGGGNGASQTPVIYPKNDVPQIVIGAPVQ